MPDPDGGAISLVGLLLSIRLNELQIENRESSIQQPTKFASATDFGFHQCYLLEEAYKLPAHELSQKVA
jgi:hypothetical protein